MTMHFVLNLPVVSFLAFVRVDGLFPALLQPRHCYFPPGGSDCIRKKGKASGGRELMNRAAYAKNNTLD